MTDNTIIKIFLASSSELKGDREQFEIFINRKNKEYIEKGIFLELVLWEDFLDAMSPTRLQDEYNKAITECDVFVSLFHTKVGKYTEEEFLKALETFKANKRPLIYTYFKDSPINLSQITDEIRSLLDFKDKLNKLGHFYTKYNDIDHLKYLFDQQLTKFIPELIDRIKPTPEKLEAMGVTESSKQQALTFYIERPPIEENCYRAIVQPGALIRIKAPEKMGKSWLLNQILNYAKGQNYQTVRLDLQLLEDEIIKDSSQFLRWLCKRVSRQLKLEDRVDEYWQGMTPNTLCTDYFEEYLLTNLNSPLVLGLDNVDRLFEEKYQTVAANFFGMLRAWWGNAQQTTSGCWQNLKLIVVYSTEDLPKLNIYQSPFNVGLEIKLPEFNGSQIQALAQQYGLNLLPRQVEQLMALVGGHPYLLCEAFNHLKTDPNVTLEELLTKASTDEGIYSGHLREHWLALDNDPELAAIFKAVVTTDNGINIDSPKQLYKLESMGLIRQEGNKVKPHCQLYRLYFREHLRKLP